MLLGKERRGSVIGEGERESIVVVGLFCMVEEIKFGVSCKLLVICVFLSNTASLGFMGSCSQTLLQRLEEEVVSEPLMDTVLLPGGG